MRSGLTEGELDGGPGRDLLRTRSNTMFVGGPGNDRLFGAGGADGFIAGASPDGSATMRGAGGLDFVSMPGAAAASAPISPATATTAPRASTTGSRLTSRS